MTDIEELRRIRWAEAFEVSNDDAKKVFSSAHRAVNQMEYQVEVRNWHDPAHRSS
jgi:hypothetical protein